MAQRYTLEALARLDLQLIAGQVSSYTDHLFNRLGRLTGPFFPKGWGDLQIVDYETDLTYMQRWPPPELQVSLEAFELLCTPFLKEASEGARRKTPATGGGFCT